MSGCDPNIKRRGKFPKLPELDSEFDNLIKQVNAKIQELCQSIVEVNNLIAAIPPAGDGSGDMLKSVYDSDLDGAIDYNDLENTPSIPAAQIQSDWNQTNNLVLDYIKNKPTIPAAQVNSDWNSVTNPSQILNKPTIPAAQVSSDWNSVVSPTEILNKPKIIDEDIIGITIDGSGSVITTGSKGFREIAEAFTITGWTITANESGSCVIDIKKSTYSGFPTTSSITASAKPTLSSVQKNQSTTLTGWTTSLDVGDMLEFVVDSASTVKRVTLFLKLLKA